MNLGPYLGSKILREKRGAIRIKEKISLNKNQQFHGGDTHFSRYTVCNKKNRKPDEIKRIKALIKIVEYLFKNQK